MDARRKHDHILLDNRGNAHVVKANRRGMAPQGKSFHSGIRAIGSGSDANGTKIRSFWDEESLTQSRQGTQRKREREICECLDGASLADRRECPGFSSLCVPWRLCVRHPPFVSIPGAWLVINPSHIQIPPYLSAIRVSQHILTEPARSPPRSLAFPTSPVCQALSRWMIVLLVLPLVAVAARLLPKMRPSVSA